MGTYSTPGRVVVVSRADMSTRSCLDLPRDAWQRPASREPMVGTRHTSTQEEAPGSRSRETSRLASAEGDEAEVSNGPVAPWAHVRPTAGLPARPVGRRWEMT